MLNKLLLELWNNKIARRAALIIKRYAIGNAPGCATVASAYLQMAGVLPEGKHYAWTLALSNKLESLGWASSTHIKKVVPGCLVFTIDDNNNDAPDHVFGVLAIEPAEHVLAVDNRNSGEPYVRNLGVGRYGSMQYALFPPS